MPLNLFGEPVLIIEMTVWFENESSLLWFIFKFVLRRHNLAAVGNITAEGGNEEKWGEEVGVGKEIKTQWGVILAC